MTNNKPTGRFIKNGHWVKRHQNILVTGATGYGKNYLACALGHEHCQQGVSVFYVRLKELLDDWGLEPLTAQQRSDLLELIDARYDKTRR